MAGAHPHTVCACRACESPLKAADGVVRAAREIRRTATTTKNVADQEQRRGLHHRTKAAYRSQMSLGFLVI